MSDQPPLSLKKAFLNALIGSVSCSALLGVAAILMGDFGEFEIRILLTTLTISAASVCGLSCGAVLESKRAWLVPLAGMVLSLLAALLIIIGLWAETSAEAFWKFAATSGILAVASSHVALLQLARLSAQFEWAKWTAHGAVYFVAGLLVVMVGGEFGDSSTFQVLGVAMILDAAITILIPVFHRLSRNDLDGRKVPDVSQIDQEIRQLELRLAELHRLKSIAEAALQPPAPVL